MTNHVTIASRLTHDRLGSYLATTGHDLDAALRLYDWNIRGSGSFHEDIGRIEVVFRNTIDAALVAYGSSRQWPTVWYRHSQLFPGKHGARTRKIIGAYIGWCPRGASRLTAPPGGVAGRT